MGLRFFLLSMAIYAAASPLHAQLLQDPPDLQEYIQSIRDLGMSEQAQAHLRTMAGIRIGASEIYFTKDSLGFYGMGFRSLTCSNPGADAAAVQGMMQELKAKMDPEMANLRYLADADSSGFVSSIEAINLRRLIEFGYKAAYVTSEEKHDMKAVCRAFCLKEDDIRSLLKDYTRLQEKARRARIQPFPEVMMN